VVAEAAAMVVVEAVDMAIAIVVRDGTNSSP